MARYIDIEKYLNDNFCDEYDECVSDEDCFVCWARRHTKDVAPVIHAEWIEKEWAEEFDNRLISNYECSNCKEWLRDKSNYCPNCGAKMDKE